MTTPTHRVELIKEYLGDIAKGDGQIVQEGVFQLVSFRVRSTKQHAGIQIFTNSSTRRCTTSSPRSTGPDWISKATITPEYKSKWRVWRRMKSKLAATRITFPRRCRVPSDDATLSMLGRKIIEGPEDGRNHFGIFELVEYSAHPPPPVKNRPAQDGFERHRFPAVIERQSDAWGALAGGNGGLCFVLKKSAPFRIATTTHPIPRLIRLAEAHHGSRFAMSHLSIS